MENFQTPVPIEWQNQRVLTTAQIAEAYHCSVKNISDNFNRAKEYFVEGVHHFKLDGTQIGQFRLRSEKIGMQISAKTRMLYLWTYQGCVRHCKMLNTDKAWEVFDVLEKNYFNSASLPVMAPAPVHVPNPNRVAGQFKDARVYAISIGDNAVKIGQSCNVAKRKSNLKSRLKVEFGKTYQTSLMTRKIARAIEKACHDIFSSSEHDGEIFYVDFEAACKVIVALEKLVGSLPLVSDFERGQKLLEAAKMMGDIPERQEMIINATNLIAGRNED